MLFLRPKKKKWTSLLNIHSVHSLNVLCDDLACVWKYSMNLWNNQVKTFPEKKIQLQFHLFCKCVLQRWLWASSPRHLCWSVGQGRRLINHPLKLCSRVLFQNLVQNNPAAKQQNLLKCCYTVLSIILSVYLAIQMQKTFYHQLTPQYF